jgi:hypothetical protein
MRTIVDLLLMCLFEEHRPLIVLRLIEHFEKMHVAGEILDRQKLCRNAFP